MLYENKLGQRCIHEWNKIKQKEAIPETPTKSAHHQTDEPRSIKADMRIVKEVTQTTNVQEKCKVMIDSGNIKRKTYSEVVKEKERKRQDEKILDLEMIKERVL